MVVEAEQYIDSADATHTAGETNHKYTQYDKNDIGNAAIQLVELTAEQQPEITVVNVLGKSGLKVEKQVIGATDDDVPPSAEDRINFNFKIEIEETILGGQTSKAYSYTLYDKKLPQVNGTDAVVTTGDLTFTSANNENPVKNAVATIQLKDGQYIIIDDLPVGVRYVVAETSILEAYYRDDSAGLTIGTQGMIPYGENAYARIVNRYIQQYTSIVLKKEPAAGTTFTPGETFVFTVHVDAPSSAGTSESVIDVVMLVNEDGTCTPVTVTNIAVGSSLTVIEDVNWSWRYDLDSIAVGSTNDADAVYEQASDISSNGVDITADQNGATIIFGNRRITDQWLSSEAYADNVFAINNGKVDVTVSSNGTATPTYPENNI